MSKPKAIPPEIRREMVAALEELAGGRCPCGRRKRDYTPFCHFCYQSLSREVRGGLQQSMAGGYLDWWRKAHDELRASGRVVQQAEMFTACESR